MYASMVIDSRTCGNSFDLRESIFDSGGIIPLLRLFSQVHHMEQLSVLGPEEKDLFPIRGIGYFL